LEVFLKNSPFQAPVINLSLENEDIFKGKFFIDKYTTMWYKNIPDVKNPETLPPDLLESKMLRWGCQKMIM